MDSQSHQQCFKVVDDALTVGRQKQVNTIVLQEKIISRSHCEINKLNGFFCVSDKGSMTGTFLKVNSKIELFNDLILAHETLEANVISIDGPACKMKVKKGKDILDYTIAKEGLKIKLSGHHLEKVEESSKESIEISYENGKFYVQGNSEKPLWIRLSSEGKKSSPYYIKDGDIVKMGQCYLFVSYCKDKTLSLGNDYNSCKICFQRENDAVLFPCKHNVLCIACAKIVKDCPICRKHVDEWIQIYR